MYFIIFFNIVSLRDKLIDLDPVVKPRGDKKRNPRNDKILKFVSKKIKHHTQFPSMEGCRAAAGWSENTRMYYILIPPCHPGAQGPHHTHLSSWGAGSPPHTPVILGLDPRIQVIKLVAYATHHLHSEL